MGVRISRHLIILSVVTFRKTVFTSEWLLKVSFSLDRPQLWSFSLLKLDNKTEKSTMHPHISNRSRGIWHSVMLLCSRFFHSISFNRIICLIYLGINSTYFYPLSLTREKLQIRVFNPRVFNFLPFRQVRKHYLKVL